MHLRQKPIQIPNVLNDLIGVDDVERLIVVRQYVIEISNRRGHPARLREGSPIRDDLYPVDIVCSCRPRELNGPRAIITAEITQSGVGPLRDEVENVALVEFK